MQMIDVLKRLAELDAQNPNIVQEKRVDESLDECGMMGGMGMSHPHSPASINMTAATGEELSGMLRDIMQLAGRPMQEPTGGEEPMGDMEPMGGADGVAVVDVEPSPEVGSDEPSIMRSMIDKLNPDDEMGDDDEEEKTDEMYDNSPDEQIAGYDAAVPSGNDLHKQKQQFPATQLGDNPMAATYEGLMAEYKKFISEDDNYTKAAVNHANRMGQMQPDKKADWDDEAAFLKTADAQEEIGQQMANDGITYSPEKEKEIIGLMAQYMKKAGMSPKQIRYLLNYNEDYISDQLSFLPRQGEADTMESMLNQEEIGQQMANDGITYSPEKEKEIIGLMAQYMKKAGMSPKQIRYLLNYNEDYISDQLSFLPRQGEADTMESMLKLAGLKK